MTYRVLDTFPVGGNTSVTIEGNGEGLRNDMKVFDTSGIEHRLLSVAMLSKASNPLNNNETIILIRGPFQSDTVIVQR